MTYVEYIAGKHTLELRVNGHSNAGVNGVDVVCAGCSALGCALAAMGEKEPGIKVEKEPGRLLVVMPANRRTREWARVIVNGYEKLAKEYPEHVTVKKV